MSNFVGVSIFLRQRIRHAAHVAEDGQQRDASAPYTTFCGKIRLSVVACLFNDRVSTGISSAPWRQPLCFRSLDAPLLYP